MQTLSALGRQRPVIRESGAGGVIGLLKELEAQFTDEKRANEMESNKATNTRQMQITTSRNQKKSLEERIEDAEGIHGYRMLM